MSSTTIVIFGASGDLTKRKLMPALFHLSRKQRLPGTTHIIGFAFDKMSDDEFRTTMRSAVEKGVEGDEPDPNFDGEAWEKFAANLWYLVGDFKSSEDFERLQKVIEEKEGEASGRLYYLATAPTFFGAIVEQLGAKNMQREDEGWRRVVLEKPFGHDLQSAQALDAEIHTVFKEEQIYRIDHYLGKETAQNILFFRFGNSMFEPVWNRNFIDHVQITVAESVTVGHRAGYYEQAGVLRDMFQNHLLELLALVAMEPPASFKADMLRNETAKVLAAIRPIQAEQVGTETVRAQYASYRKEEGVAADSQTPTFAALRLFVDNWRWQDIPFYLRSGKALVTKSSEINIQFRQPPHNMFPNAPELDLRPGRISICIQPDEGINMYFEVKAPDTSTETRTVPMSFRYGDLFGPTGIPDAYERLLLDAIQGDAALFIRNDAIDLSWQIIDQINAGWNSPAAPPLATYEDGSTGPAEADRFISADNRKWLDGCGCWPEPEPSK